MSKRSKRILTTSTSSSWCDQCEAKFPEACSRHGEVIIIKDTEAPLKAYYTLPDSLYLQTSQQNDSRVGVFAKNIIETRTQFGPVEASVEWCPNASAEFNDFEVKDGDTLVKLDLNNKAECNWMMFVQPATDLTNHNLVAIFHNKCIYYLANKKIEKNTELCVWYSKHYASSIGKSSSLPKLTKSKVILDSLITNTNDLQEYSDTDNDVNILLQNDPEFIPQKRLTKGGKRRRKKGGPSKIDLQQRNKKISNLAIKSRVVKERKPKVVEKKLMKKPRYVCAICKEGFAREVQYELHVAEHSGTLPYICQVEGCGKGFKSKFPFFRHQSIHQEIQTLSCRFCDKTFRRKEHLKNHMLIHDSNRNVWKCDACDKTYIRQESYTFHKAVHHAKENEVPHCLICKKDFDSREQVIKHLKDCHNRYKSITGKERTVKCPMCDKMFLSNKDIRRHMILHTKKKEFLCDICSQVFGRKDHLARHCNSVHSSGDKKKTIKFKRKSNEKKSDTVVSETPLENSTNTKIAVNDQITTNDGLNFPVELLEVQQNNRHPRTIIIPNSNEGTHEGRFVPPSYEDVTRKPENTESNPVPNFVNFNNQNLVGLLDIGGRQGSHTIPTPLSYTDNNCINDFITSSQTGLTHNATYLSLTDHSYMINAPRPVSTINQTSNTIKHVGELSWDSEELRKREYETASYLQSFANSCVPVTNNNNVGSVSNGQSSQLSWDTVLSYAKQFSSTPPNHTTVLNNNSNIT